MASKAPDAFRTISEVSDWLGVSPHVLRFWESKFTQVKPVKRAGGRRYYRPADMELLGGIRKLLHDDGLTVKGVQKMLREQGPRSVAALSPPVDEVPEPQDGAPAAAPIVDTVAQKDPASLPLFSDRLEGDKSSGRAGPGKVPTPPAANPDTPGDLPSAPAEPPEVEPATVAAPDLPDDPPHTGTVQPDTLAAEAAPDDDADEHQPAKSEPAEDENVAAALAQTPDIGLGGTDDASPDTMQGHGGSEAPDFPDQGTDTGTVGQAGIANPGIAEPRTDQDPDTAETDADPATGPVIAPLPDLPSEADPVEASAPISPAIPVDFAADGIAEPRGASIDPAPTETTPEPGQDDASAPADPDPAPAKPVVIAPLPDTGLPMAARLARLAPGHIAAADLRPIRDRLMTLRARMDER